MGVVVAARHATLGHRVALKLVSEANLADADAFARFSREARVVASLESDHIVRVTDFGMHGATPYMVMELLAGRDLGSEMRERNVLPAQEAADYLIQACDGLSVAHAKGVVHRDVKLANLFLSVRADGQRVVKVLDFGVSKLQGAAQDEPSLTRTTVMIGSPAYMSPEQLRDPRTVDARADVWSLGVALYRMLTNASPFEGLSTTALCAAIAADSPTQLRPRAPEVPGRLEAVVLRCLEKRPEARYPSVAALARELAEFASPRGKALAEAIVQRAVDAGTLDAVPDSPADVARPLDDSAAASVVDTRARRLLLPRRSWRAWGTGAIVALVTAVAAIVATRGAARSPASSTPPPPFVAPAAMEVVAPAAGPSPSAIAASPPQAPPTVSGSLSTPTTARPARRRPQFPSAPVSTPRAATTASVGFGGTALDDHH
jgi:serine/threonine-protein kinase